jgi:3-dehydroquinate synthase
MLAEAYLSYQKGLLNQGELSQIDGYISSVWPAVDLSDAVATNSLELLKQDKKNEGGNLLFSLLSQIGKCEYNLEVSASEAQEALRWYQQKSRP